MSNINPYNIDGTFPVAGQDNSSQGFRDNFTNTQNNFLFARNEIKDLQDKVLVTSALTGQGINNDMAGTKIIRPQLDAWTQTLYDHGNVSTSAILDFNIANFQKITTSGSIALSFTNWPTTTGVGAVGYGLMRIWIHVTNTGHTVTFPSSVNIGDDDLAGYQPDGVLTFDEIGDYIFDISSVDSGNNYLIFDLTRNRSRIRDNATITGNATIGGNTSIGGAATITSNASIGGNATVGGFISVGSNASIGGSATIGGSASITTTANVGGDAGVGGNATITGFAHIGGAATIGGTASIGGNTTISGGITTNGGHIEQATYVFPLALTGASTIVANTAMSTIIIDSVSSGVITTANISLPASPADRQVIKIASAAQITTANVYDPVGYQVKWVPAGTFSSGNIAITLTYISSSSTWYRS